MKNKILIFTLTFLFIFSSWFVIYKSNLNNLVIQSEDTVPTLFVPLAILKDRTLYLDNYYSQMISKYPHPDDKSYTLGLVPFYVKKIGEHYLSAFPIITSLLVLPLYLIALKTGVTFSWENLAIISHLGGAFIISISAVAFYILVHEKISLTYKNSVFLTFIYIFATINFSLVSQGLWQHGTVQLFSILSLISLINFCKTKNSVNIVWFGFWSGIAVLSRPTAALVVCVIAVYILWHKDFIKRGLLMGLGILLPLLFFIWYNTLYYVGIQNQGYSSQVFRNWLGDFPLSFFGVWLSPSKGILIYSPVFLFALLGAIYLFGKMRSIENKYVYLLGLIIVFLHTLIISFWKHWFGGWSFGYRMSSDVLPFIVLLLIPWIESSSYNKYYKTFIFTLVISLIIQFSGLIFFDGVWHAAYDRGYQNTSWLWSLKDSEALFNLRRVLVKFGYLQRACENCEPIVQ